MINYGRHFLDKTDLKSVIQVLKNKNLTQGEFVQKFENKLKKKFKARFCSVVSSGTAALHLVGLALKWKKGDIVITSPGETI